MDPNRKNALLDNLNKILDKVQNINASESPNNAMMIDLHHKDWNTYKKDIVREVLKRDDITINVNAGFGGGFNSETHWISLHKQHGLPAINEEDMEKNINEILGL